MPKSRSVSRRQMLASAAMAAPMFQLINAFTGRALAQRRMTAGGSGPIQVLLVTKGHGFDRAPFFELFDALGETITWTHVEQPAAQVFWDPKLAEPYDVFVHYDAMGRQEMTRPDGSTYFEAPPRDAQENLAALLKQGKGMVFFHHSIAAWNQAWPEYPEIVGGACDWRNPVTVRDQKFPFSGFRPNTEQHVTVVDKNHPVVQGLGDGFDITDEAYLCPYFEDSIHPLLRTNFDPKVANFPIQTERDPKWNHPDGSNVAAWVKAAESSPVVYVQLGHDATAWVNESFRMLMTNAIKWAASDEAMAWAKANPAKIF